MHIQCVVWSDICIVNGQHWSTSAEGPSQDLSFRRHHMFDQINMIRLMQVYSTINWATPIYWQFILASLAQLCVRQDRYGGLLAFWWMCGVILLQLCSMLWSTVPVVFSNMTPWVVYVVEVAAALYECCCRSLIYPMLMKDAKRVPLSVFLLALLCCLYNSFMQTRYLLYYAVYPDIWITSPKFMCGKTISDILASHRR